MKKLNSEIGLLNDDLEIKISERTTELKEAIIDLEKKNVELEQASYIISFH